MTDFNYEWNTDREELPELDLSSTEYPRQRVGHLYRCERYDDDDSHAGARFFRTWRDAKEEARLWPRAEITRVIYSPGKDALMHILNHLGGHPDNG